MEEGFSSKCLSQTEAKLKRIRTCRIGKLIWTTHSTWKYPDIPGLKSFQGTMMHSANWDPATNFGDKVVAVVGGGSSAVQIIPQLQKGRLYTAQKNRV